MCRDVTLPNGPLYRVAGFPLSLPCAVSGYEGPRTQEFEWFLYRDDAGGRQMGVVSTRDKGFPYTPFQARVRNGEVRVERDSGDKVRLMIQRLRAEDQGKYECYTPSTDSTYQGNYSGTVIVKGKTQIRCVEALSEGFYQCVLANTSNSNRILKHIILINHTSSLYISHLTLETKVKK